jgi:hypothetical protein
MKMYCLESRSRGISYVKYVNGRRTGLVTFCVHVIEGEIPGGMEVTGRRGRSRRKLLDDLKERRGYSHLKRKLWIALYGELALE